MPLNNSFDHDEKSRTAWLNEEKRLRMKLLCLSALIIFFIVLIICDVIYFKSVIVSVISVFGSIISIIEFVEKKNNLNNKGEK